MARLTPEEFKARLLRLSNERGTVMERATGTAAGHVKRELVASARSRVTRTPKARAGWVKYVVAGNPEGATGKVYPRGGFPILAEKGSYKKPAGYQVPRPGKKRRGRGWIGPFHHPGIRPQPWWQTGWSRAEPGVIRIYAEAVSREVQKHFG